MEGDLVDHKPDLIEKAISDAEKLLETTGGAGLEEKPEEEPRSSTGQHNRADDGYRGHKPSGVSRRQQKRAIKRTILSTNRGIRREARRVDPARRTTSGPSEKALARAAARD